VVYAEYLEALRRFLVETNSLPHNTERKSFCVQHAFVDVGSNPD